MTYSQLTKFRGFLLLIFVLILISGCNIPENYQFNVDLVRDTGFDKEAWNMFEECISDSRRDWDSEKQQCFDFENPNGCFILNRWEQILSKDLPINIPTKDIQDYQDFTVYAYCLDWTVSRTGNDCDEVGHYKLTSNIDNLTLCWNSHTEVKSVDSSQN